MREDYKNALKAGKMAAVKARLSGRSPYLPVLDSFVGENDIRGKVHLGLQELPIEMIVGNKSEARSNAFANNFMPLLAEGSEFGSKWSSLYDSCIEEGVRDAITCYEYLGNYYVGEGNKRVSVSKYIGAEFILADVTRLLPVESEDRDIVVYGEFLKFYEVSGIFMIKLTTPGGYEKLSSLAGCNLEEKWPDSVVNDIKSAYIYFRKEYRKEGAGEDMNDVSEGDAFLVYISIFPYLTLMDDSGSQIRSNIKMILDEIFTNGDSEKVSYLSEPVSSEETTGIRQIFHRNSKYSASKPLKVAFIYDAGIEDSRWIDGHEAGRLYAQEKLGERVKTGYYIADSAENGVSEAIKKAVDDKNRMIFTVCPSMLNDTLKASLEKNDIRFLNCSIGEPYAGVRSYHARFYEAAFLSGVLAGQAVLGCENAEHIIGYLSDRPEAGKIADINAFAIGASMIDPKCRISLKWSALSDFEDCLLQWKEMGVKVYSDAEYSPDKTDASRKRGVFVMKEDGDIYLGAPYYNWGRYYSNIIQSMLEDTWDLNNMMEGRRSTSYYFGISTGVTDIRLGDAPYQTKRLIGLLRNGIIDGAVNPFAGELHSTDRLILGDPKGKLSDFSEDTKRLKLRNIINMDWLNDNVDGIIPDERQMHQL